MRALLFYGVILIHQLAETKLTPAFPLFVISSAIDESLLFTFIKMHES
jgi:hypothetical protein